MYMRKFDILLMGPVVLGALFIGFLLNSCANKGYPEGGPRDVTPPHVIAEQPVSFSKNFKRKNINIYFDEFVALKNINEKFIISPPQNKKPRVRLRARYIMVEFEDTLRPQTTYSLDFADAIVDNNEGNPLGYYRYVFSTGNVIDTMELSGNVVNAGTNEPVLNAYVFLYENTADSVPLKEIPAYMGRTDSSGFFRITNIRETDYKVVAVMDENRDYKYTPEGEQVAFLDSLVRPVVFPVVHTDTLENDSVVTREYLAYGPNNLYLRMFLETSTQLYMVDEGRKERELLNFVFSIPGKNDFAIELLDTVVEGKWYLPEVSSGGDTLNLWIRDSVVYRRDTLNFRLTYLRTDSTGIQVPYADTVKLVYTDKKTQEKNKRKKKEQEKPKIEFLKIDLGIGQEQDVNTGFYLEFDRPVTEDFMQAIRLSEKVDTVYEPVDFTLREDSIRIRRFYVEKKWKPEAQYQLQIDSAAIRDIYGHINDKVEKKFKVKALESYGMLNLSVEGTDGQAIVQLYKPDSKKTEKGDKIFNVVAEKIVDKDGEITFDFLHEGKYRLRAILDKNRNGKWDPGLYLEKRQPEEVRYLPVEINIKQNFDVEQHFDLKGSYIGGELQEVKDDRKKKTNRGQASAQPAAAGRSVTGSSVPVSGTKKTVESQGSTKIKVLKE